MHQSNAMMSLKPSITQRLRTDLRPVGVTAAAEIVCLTGFCSKSPHFATEVQLIRHAFTNFLINTIPFYIKKSLFKISKNKIELNIGFR